MSSATGCTLPDGITQPTDASIDATDAADTSTEEVFDDGLNGDGRGHCFTADDGNVSCDPGMVCAYTDAGAYCTERSATARLKECGLVACDLDSLCFCANARTSACLCNFSAGPLAPPNLPANRPSSL